jgi:hypothetical protein
MSILHAWGYEFDDAGAYTGLWVTGPDNEITEMTLLSVQFDFDEELWFLDTDNTYGYAGFFINSVQVLEPEIPDSAIPEPSSLILTILGLVGVIGISMFRRKMRNTRK